jgi:heme oxygenase
MSLKELTADLHTEAERTKFMKSVMTGTITTAEYTNYLWQMIPVYSALEFGCKDQGFFYNMPGIERLPSIYQDFKELAEPDTHYVWTKETLDYNRYVLDLLNDPTRKHLIKAHSYCRHLGDLYGGQFIAKLVPGSGKFYQFDDVAVLRTAIRAALTDDLGDEAKVAFEWAIKIMNAL